MHSYSGTLCRDLYVSIDKVDIFKSKVNKSYRPLPHLNFIADEIVAKRVSNKTRMSIRFLRVSIRKGILFSDQYSARLRAYNVTNKYFYRGQLCWPLTSITFGERSKLWQKC